MNGNKTEQSFHIYSGSGSNAKTSTLGTVEEAFGGYFEKINMETLTKSKKSGNETSELYQTKGKRVVVANEAEQNNEAKLQVCKLKLIADGTNGFLKERALFKNSVSFQVQWIIYCM